MTKTPPSCTARHRATAAQFLLSAAALIALWVFDGWAIPAVIGIWLGVAGGWGMGYDHHRAHDQKAMTALAELVRLKDGPRDDAYERDKPAAWQRARDALAAHRRHPGNDPKETR